MRLPFAPFTCALREDPTPFLGTYPEEANQTVEQMAARLAPGSPGTDVLGAFRADVLIGTLVSIGTLGPRRAIARRSGVCTLLRRSAVGA
jgi:hypothetical protein